MFLTAFSTRVSLLSSKIHNGDDTPKDLYRASKLKDEYGYTSTSRLYLHGMLEGEISELSA